MYKKLLLCILALQVCSNAIAASSSSASSISSSIKSSSISSSSKSSVISSSSIASSSSSEKWLFRGTPNNFDLNSPLTKSGNVFVTCQDFAANDPRFRISNGNKLIPNDFVEAFPASDLRVAINTSFDITFNSTTHEITTTARAVPCAGLNIDRSLIVHDQAVLNFSDDAGPVFGLKRVLQQLAAQANIKNPTHPTSAAEVFARMWDSQHAPENAVFANGPKCTGTMHNFPNECRFVEAEQARLAEEFMGKYIPIALVNRFDLHEANFADCGEYRVIYAIKGIPAGRNFIIFEARLRNPVPGNKQMCLPIVNFWKNLTIENDSNTRAQLLANFYFKGLPGNATFAPIDPVFSVENYAGKTGGQIRTNEFMGNSWLLKEFKVGIVDGLSLIMPVSVKSNPFGELANDNLRKDPLAVDFRSKSIQNMATLINPDLTAFSLLIKDEDDAQNNVQSHSSGDTSENNFLAHVNRGSAELKDAIQKKADALHTNLTPDQIINRATAMTCAGCHNPAAFNLTSVGSVGPNQAWPLSLDFTHVSENAVDGKFNLSPALLNVFLPSRKSGMETFLNSFIVPAGSSIAPATIQSAPQEPVLSGRRSG